MKSAICLRKVKETTAYLDKILGDVNEIRIDSLDGFKEWALCHTGNIKEFNAIHFAVASWKHQRQQLICLSMYKDKKQKRELKHQIEISKVYLSAIKEIRHFV